ncbi:iron-sulfur protein [Tistrella bauzanensis]|uniref:Iron-sulfur protein n=1 Tax=Tistrella bauzanensis TaxID=657419 RepID=A0ABQ1IXF8_9PROT|nr:PDR/VanB family oxidoreductase [Tistrella bauzanensis]GGB54798.1 iron-sulfur protein [Tistrella bauzanensis]
MKLIHHVTTTVVDIRRETPRITVYELADPDGWDLPPFTPGSHIDVFLDDRTARQYSLCGPGSRPDRYRIAVQREDAGRGGSRAIHEGWTLGTIVPVSLPRNTFHMGDGHMGDGAAHRILVAGGIGITPIIAMAEALAGSGARFELHYAARSPEEAAFRDALENGPFSDRVTFHYSNGHDGKGNGGKRAGRLDLPGLLAAAAPGTHTYICGPKPMIDEARDVAEATGRDDIHLEQFGAHATITPGAETAYVVDLARSGGSVEVAVGQTMLDALRQAGVEIEASCHAGVCTSCKTRYLAGSPLHKDLVMSPADRREFVTPCVSEVMGARIVLDL